MLNFVSCKRVLCCKKEGSLQLYPLPLINSKEVLSQENEEEENEIEDENQFGNEIYDSSSFNITNTPNPKNTKKTQKLRSSDFVYHDEFLVGGDSDDD